MEVANNKNTYSIKITYSKLVALLVVFAIGFNFLGEITHGIYQAGFLDELSCMFVLSLGLFSYFSIKRKVIYHPKFLVYYFVLSLIYLLFYKMTTLSFLYEYYKLFIFLIFLPLFNFLDQENLKLIFRKFFILMIYVFVINLIFIVLQYITQNDILRWINYNVLRTDNWERYGRYTGLFDVATLGFTSLLVLFLNELVNKNKQHYKVVLFLAVISVLFSSSKASYLILIVWIILYYKKYFVKHGHKILIGLFLLAAVTYYYTADTISIKIKQYSYFIENFDNRPVLNLDFVEKRVLFLAESFSIVKQHPFGLGLGTFGDASVFYNPNAYRIPPQYWYEKNVSMADSVIAHVLAEQGITSILYFGMILIAPFFFIKRKLLKFYAMYVFFYMILSISTMGLSAGSFPILFALIFALFYYSKKFDEVFTLS